MGRTSRYVRATHPGSGAAAPAAAHGGKEGMRETDRQEGGFRAAGPPEGARERLRATGPGQRPGRAAHGPAPTRSGPPRPAAGRTS